MINRKETCTIMHITVDHSGELIQDSDMDMLIAMTSVACHKKIEYHSR
jgi:hypothetical protein